MNETEISNLVHKLDVELEKHNLTFEEFLLYSALHNYENHNKELMKSLEDKGYIEEGRVVDREKLGDIYATLGAYFTPTNESGRFEREDFLRMFGFLFLYDQGNRPL